MASIKVGDRTIPVIDFVEFNGEPSAPSWAAVLSVLYSKGWTAKTLFQAGWNIASSYSDARAVQENRYSVGHIGGGRTGLGDSSEMIVSIDQTIDPENTMNRTEIMHLNFTRQDGEIAVSLYPQEDWTLCSMWGSTWPATQKHTEVNVVAIKFLYPNASEPEYRVASYALGFIQNGITSTSDSYTVVNSALFIPIAYINKTKGTSLDYEGELEPEDDPNEDDPEANKDEEDGGDGDHTPTYDPIPVPYKPTQGAATAGFITMYKLHQAAMMQFADDMFADNIWEALKLFFSNPMDFLVGVNLVPFDPPAPVSWKPKFGATAIFEHAYPAISNQYYDVDCGTVSIPKYWGSCFDYEPYTKIQIWLPYIGYRDLPVDEIMGCSINVLYRCDCLTGDCVAFVTISGDAHVGPQIVRVIAQFYGNCAVRVPFGSVSFDSAVSNSIQLMGAAASGGLSAGAGAMMETGGAFGGLAAGAGAFANAAVNSAGVRNSAIGVVQGMKPNVMKGGAAGSSTGYMSIQKPYLIRRIPRLSLPSNYKGLKGYPCNIGGKLADFTGLAAVDDIQLNDIPAMEDERGEIMQWLKGGVLI